jgi:hypothetical protein
MREHFSVSFTELAPIFIQLVVSFARTNDCSGNPELPISIPLLGGLTIVNPFDVGQLLGGSGKCKKLEL